MLSVRSIETKEGRIVAICDLELLGKKFKEGKAVLDLEKYSSFYQGLKIPNDSPLLDDLVKKAKSVNAVGLKSLRALERLGFDVSGTKKVKGVPHLQVYRI